MDLKCEKCKLTLGEMDKGKIRNGAVLLCRHCWEKAEAAMGVAETASNGMPDFMKDLMGKKGF